MSQTTRIAPSNPNHFVDTFKATSDPTKYSFTDRDLRVTDFKESRRIDTYEAWKAESVRRAPQLDKESLDYFQNHHTNAKSYFDQSIDHENDVQDVDYGELPLRPNRTGFGPMWKDSDRRQTVGYTGHKAGGICKELIRKPSLDPAEPNLLQDLSRNLSSSIKPGFDFGTYAPTFNMYTTSARASESAVRTKRRFQVSERFCGHKSQAFVKHGMIAKKFMRQDEQNKLNMMKKGEKNTFSTSRSNVMQPKWR